MPYPNLIIAGAPKSGTSSLFSNLTAHPEGGWQTKKKHDTFLIKAILFFQQIIIIIKKGWLAILGTWMK